MTSSKNFICERMKNSNSFADLSVNDIEKASEIDFLEFCNERNFEVPEFISHNVDGDFNYCVSSFRTCDSTLSFAVDCIEEVVLRVLNRITFYVDIVKDPDKCKISYEVDNIILVSREIEPPDKSKKWLRHEYAAILPVKFIYGE